MTGEENHHNHGSGILWVSESDEKKVTSAKIRGQKYLHRGKHLYVARSSSNATSSSIVAFIPFRRLFGIFLGLIDLVYSHDCT
jgi:hypothetical protein